MPRDLGVRSKLLVLLSVPLVLALALSALIVGDGLSGARAAARVEQLAATSGGLNTLVHALQAERAATAVWVRAKTPENQATLLAERRRVDACVLAVQARVADMPLGQFFPALAEGFTAAARQHDALDAMRARADAAQSLTGELGLAYDQVIAVDLALSPLVALAADGALAASLRSYGVLATAIEQSARERDLLATAFAANSLGRTGYTELAGMIANQESALVSFDSSANAEQQGRLRAALASADTSSLATLRLRAGDLLTLQTAPTDPREWTDVANRRIAALIAVESSLVADVEQAATQRVGALRQQVAVVGGLASLALAVALTVALALARRMVEPLLTLTRAATETADGLPAMVERMQRPDAEPAARAPIAVTSGDEFGRLAAAFNTINDATVRVAQEQAELREGVATMFVNVARRNQVLLGRQLTFIDVMESNEENPDTLDNLFKLDHLATRMRRNAESLLVLAGLDSTRRLRESLALSDVIRTAVSEIEAYDRVDLVATQDARLHGRSALSVAHLLAELLENATHFSNPDTRVLVSCGPGNGGIEVTITDHGLGMGADELAAANAAITSTSNADVAVSQRLGFAVVGRLAQRMAIPIAVRPGSQPGPGTGLSYGTVVTLTLPAMLFEEAVTMRGPRPDVPPEPVPTPAPPSAAASSAPAIDIVPGDGGSRRRRRTVPGLAAVTQAYVPAPGAAPDTAMSEPVAAGDRPRTAADVRGMLSGFREGVERGRSTSPARPAAPETADSDQPAPPPTG